MYSNEEKGDIFTLSLHRTGMLRIIIIIIKIKNEEEIKPYLD